VCSHPFVVDSLTRWIVDMEATKHIVLDKTEFMKFHRYPVSSQNIVLENSSDEDVLRVGIYQPRLHRGNKLLLHDTLYASGV